MRHRVQTADLLSPFLTAILAAVLVAIIAPFTASTAVADNRAAVNEAKNELSALPGIIVSPPIESDGRHRLSRHDHDAALEAIQIALVEVQDGASYVWRRRHGQLNGGCTADQVIP